MSTDRHRSGQMPTVLHALPGARFSIGGQRYLVVSIDDDQALIEAHCWECGAAFSQTSPTDIPIAPIGLTRRCAGCRPRHKSARVRGRPANPVTYRLVALSVPSARGGDRSER